MPEETSAHAATVRDALSRNVVVDVLSRVGYMFSRFFVPPFILARISLEAYGLWSTSFILVSYIGVSTLGISNVYIKYVAQHSARREYQQANALLSTGVFLTLPICFLLFAALWLAWPFLATLLHIPSHLMGDAHEVILSVVATFLASICLSVFHDVLVGVQRTALVQYIWTACYIVETALIFLLVGMGRGVRGLAEAYVARTALEIVLSMPAAFRVIPWLRISWRRFSREALHTLFFFGGVVQIQSLLAIFLDSVERAIAAPLLGLEATGLLDISQKLPTMGATIPGSFASAFLPAASYLHGGLDGSEEQRDSIRKLYLKGARYMNLSAGYICGFVGAISVPLLSVWLGKGYPGAAYLMTVFAVATQVHLLTGPGTAILRGIGQPKEEFYYCLPNLALLAVTVPLVRIIQGKWTTLGIGTAVPLATVLAAIYFVLRANRLLRVPLREYLRFVVGPGAIPYLLAACFTFPLGSVVSHSSRWVGAAWILLAGFLYTVLLALVVHRLVWETGERLWFEAIIGKSLNRLRRRG